MGCLFDVALDRYESVSQCYLCGFAASMGFWQMVGSGRVLAVGLNGLVGPSSEGEYVDKILHELFLPEKRSK